METTMLASDWLQRTLDELSAAAESRPSRRSHRFNRQAAVAAIVEVCEPRVLLSATATDVPSISTGTVEVNFAPAVTPVTVVDFLADFSGAGGIPSLDGF